MATEELYRQDSYLRECDATVVAINDRNGIILDQTVFYPTGGGQPGDTGLLRLADGSEVHIATTVKGDAPGEIVHVPAEDQPVLSAGDCVTAAIDWDRRYRHMRIHTCLHLLSAILPYPVTGGQIAADKGRLDFDIPEGGLDKAEITTRLNALVQEDHSVLAEWITDEELDSQPDLVKTMSVQPPRGAGKVRLINVDGQDLQPCGGTHVARTSEIGQVEVRKIEKKGRQNRRVVVGFSDG